MTETGRDLAADLLKRARSPSLIGAAVGAAAAAGLATRKSPTRPHDADPDEDRAPDVEGDEDESSEQQQQPAGRGDDREAGLREQVLDGFFERLRQDKYFDVGLMDRVERLIETRGELERYLELLVDKVGSETYVTGDTLNRVERLLAALGRLQRSQSV